MNFPSLGALHTGLERADLFGKIAPALYDEDDDAFIAGPPFHTMTERPWWVYHDRSCTAKDSELVESFNRAEGG